MTRASPLRLSAACDTIRSAFSAMATHAPIFNVLTSVNLSYQTHARLLGGILAYVKTHTAWTLNLFTGRRDEPRQFDTSTVDGIILNDKMIPKWLNTSILGRIPTVMVTPSAEPSFPCCLCACDNAPIAAMAARHLLSKHCEAYAFVHSSGQLWSDARGRLFAEAVKAEGCRFLWQASEQKKLVRLIADSPKPLGVFAATDILARATLDACQVVGCKVPDDVLILGVDNDVTLCEMSNPTLSSIPLSSYDAGYRVAEIMDRALKGEYAPDEMPNVFFTGGPVVERLSTARSFAYNMLVRRCRELLETEFASPIRVSDLAARFRVSRRTLETHFRAVTGTTIAEEVIRLRIEHAKGILATTAKPIDQIAVECGFYDSSHFSAMFLRHVGVRPSAFRERL